MKTTIVLLIVLPPGGLAASLAAVDLSHSADWVSTHGPGVAPAGLVAFCWMLGGFLALSAFLEVAQL